MRRFRDAEMHRASPALSPVMSPSPSPSPTRSPPARSPPTRSPPPELRRDRFQAGASSASRAYVSPEVPSLSLLRFIVQEWLEEFPAALRLLCLLALFVIVLATSLAVYWSEALLTSESSDLQSFESDPLEEDQLPEEYLESAQTSVFQRSMGSILHYFRRKGSSTHSAGATARGLGAPVASVLSFLHRGWSYPSIQSSHSLLGENKYAEAPAQEPESALATFWAVGLLVCLLAAIVVTLGVFTLIRVVHTGSTVQAERWDTWKKKDVRDREFARVQRKTRQLVRKFVVLQGAWQVRQAVRCTLGTNPAAASAATSSSSPSSAGAPAEPQ